VFAGLEVTVALNSCLFLTPVLRIYQRLPISRCMISRSVQFPLFSEVFSTPFLPLGNSSTLCLDRKGSLPSMCINFLQLVIDLSFVVSRHSCASRRIVRGQLAQTWLKFRQLITLFETCQIHIYGGKDKTAKLENVTRNFGRYANGRVTLVWGL